jgi:peptide/nickel transport system substrate-binding protein
MVFGRALLGGIAAVAFAISPALAGKRDDTLKVASGVVPESIDAYMNNVREGVILAHHIWSNLVYRNPKTNQYEGELATSWKWVDDRTLEFELRQGVKFHNGDAFSADDVVYTLSFISKPENKVVTQQNVNWIESAEKLGDYKVRIRTKTPFPAALEYLAGPVVIYPGKYYAQVGPKGMNDKPVGSGPYKVTENVPGKVVRMAKNTEVFKESPRGQPSIGKIEFRLIPEQNTQLAELMSGGLDWIWRVPPDQATQLQRVPTVQVVGGETMRFAFIHLAATEKSPQPALRDVRVRQAIAHAIDREAIVKNLVGEGSRILHTMCFPSQFGCTDEGAPRYNYDPAKAKKLLADAGFANGFELEFWAYRQPDRPQTEAMINYLREVGIKATMRFVQYAAMRDALREHKAAMGHQTWGSFSINDTSASAPVFLKFEADDLARDEQVKNLLTVADGSVDEKVRKENYQKALARAAELALTVPLYSIPTTYAFSKELAFTPHADEIPRWFESKWK